MSTQTLNTLLKEYEKKKFKAELAFEEARNNFYNIHPDIAKINSELNKTALDISKAILNNDENSVKNLKKYFNDLKFKKGKLLENVHIPLEVKEPLYECKFCKDTGYVTDSNNKTVLCNCIKQKIFDIEFNKSNIGNLEKENFYNFDLSLYSDEINEKKYNAKISPRQNILNIKNIAEKFVANFENPEEKNLLFLGNTGLRKNLSFKLHCKRNIRQRKNCVIPNIAYNARHNY